MTCDIVPQGAASAGIARANGKLGAGSTRSPQYPDGTRSRVLNHFFRRSITMATTSSAATTTTKPKAVKASKDSVSRQRQAQRAAILLKQLSDPTRLQVVRILSDGEVHVGALCEALNLGQPAVSHHLALLRHGSIIAPRRQGKNNFYALTETGEQLAKVVKAVLP